MRSIRTSLSLALAGSLVFVGFHVRAGDAMFGAAHELKVDDDPWHGTVTVLMGDGKGGLSAASELKTLEGAHAIAVGDLDGDGKPDLVVAHGGIGTVDGVSIFLTK